jgi:hypothetical protein
MTIGMSGPAKANPIYRLPSLQILADELDEFKRTGRHVHLLHAMRALDDARGELNEFVHYQLPPAGAGAGQLERPNER